MDLFKFTVCISGVICLSSACQVERGLALVKNGKSEAVIVVPEPVSELQQIAIDDFRQTIHRSTGVLLPTSTISQAVDLPETTVRIVLGPSAETERLGIQDDLKEEEFRVLTRGNKLIILARDLENRVRARDSLVSTWAFSYLLENFVGVSWLWPGELGTVVEKRDTIEIPKLDYRWQPPLLSRSINLNYRRGEELKLWAAHHQFAGRRVNYRFQHSFRKNMDNGDWWGEFHETHPEYLAKNPDDEVAYVNNRPHFFKLCISNPDVTEEIIRRWEQAGSPDFWDVTPNDGNGFCSCDNCMALDQKYGDVSYTKEEVWKRPDHVVLTDRYVWFWNQLIRKMQTKNPSVKIGVYFYSAYRTPPKKLKLEEGIVGEMVHGFDFSNWLAWQEAGVTEIGLRPNWWHMGANGPHIPLHKAGDYVEKARAGGMRLIKMDTMLEYWSTQGPFYYLMGRLVARPDLDTEAIITEYCDAFGTASGHIRRYLDYWEDYHEQVAYNIPAGGKLSQGKDGIYERICREHFGDALHPLRGHWQTMPYIYTEDILNRGRAILDEALSVATKEEAQQRIQFLRDGLRGVALCADFMAQPKDKQEPALKELVKFGNQMENKYGYWGSEGIWMMKNWGIIGEELDLSGM